MVTTPEGVTAIERNGFRYQRQIVSVTIDLLNSFTLAQVMDFIKFANENICTNVTAAIMAYKNAHYGNENVMDEFVL